MKDEISAAREKALKYAEQLERDGLTEAAERVHGQIDGMDFCAALVPAWPPVLPPGTLVVCSDCDAGSEESGWEVAEVAVNDNGPNSPESVDLLCSKCKLVIATLFRGPA